MKGLFGRSSGGKSSGKNSIQQAVATLQAQQAAADGPKTEGAASGAESDQLRAEVARLQAENDALKGQVHLYQFKVRHVPGAALCHRHAHKTCSPYGRTRHAGGDSGDPLGDNISSLQPAPRLEQLEPQGGGRASG